MWLLHILIQNALCLTSLIDSRVAGTLSNLNELGTRWAITAVTVIQLADHAAEHLVSRLLDGAAAVVTISMNSAHLTKPLATLAATNATAAHIVHATISATKGNLSTCTNLIVHPLATPPPPFHETFLKIAYNGIAHNIAKIIADNIAREWKDSPLTMAILVIFVVWFLLDQFPREGRTAEFSFYDMTTEHMHNIFNMQEQYTASLDAGSLDGLDAGRLQPRLPDEITPAPVPIHTAGIMDNGNSAYFNTAKLTSIDELLVRGRIKFAEFPATVEEPEAEGSSRLSQMLASSVPDTCDRQHETTAIAPAATSSTSTAASNRTALTHGETASAASQPELEAAVGAETGQEHQETLSETDFELDRDVKDIISSKESLQDQAEDDDNEEVFIYPGSDIDVHAQGAPCADGDYHAGPSTSSSLEEHLLIYAASEPYASTLRPTANKFIPACSARSNATRTEANTTSGRPGEFVNTASTSTLRRTANEFVPSFSARLNARAEATASSRPGEATHTASSSALRSTAKEFVPSTSPRSNAHTETTVSDRPGDVIYVATPGFTEGTFASSLTGSNYEGSRSGLDVSPQAKAQSFTRCFPTRTRKRPERRNYGARQGPSARGNFRGNSWGGNGGPSQERLYAPPHPYPTLSMLPALPRLPPPGAYNGGAYAGGVYAHSGGVYGGGVYAYGGGAYGGGLYAYGPPYTYGEPYGGGPYVYGGSHSGGPYAYGGGGWWGARGWYSNTWGN